MRPFRSLYRTKNKKERNKMSVSNPSDPSFDKGNPDHVLAALQMHQQRHESTGRVVMWAIFAVLACTAIILLCMIIVIPKFPSTDLVKSIIAQDTIDKDEVIKLVKEHDQIGVDTVRSDDEITDLVEKYFSGTSITLGMERPEAEELLKSRDEKIALLEKELDDLKKVMAEAPTVQQSAVTPAKAVPVASDAPSPSSWNQETPSKEEFDKNKVVWVNSGRYNIPTRILNGSKRGITGPTHPPVPKPAGWENSDWVVINGQDWALVKWAVAR